MTTYFHLASALSNALNAFDEKIAPQGLYAAEEHGVTVPRRRWALEWEECLKPALQQIGAAIGQKDKLCAAHEFNNAPFVSKAEVTLPVIRKIDLFLIRVSKIKVRKFGNAYRIDPHHDFSDRWKSLHIANFLKRSSPNQTRRWGNPAMLVLVGFDGRSDPFRKELTNLHDKRPWEQRGWQLQTDSWPDPHHRAFFTLSAVWAPLDSTISIPPCSNCDECR